MGQSFLKIIFVGSLLALSFAEPQWTIGAGSSQLLGEAKAFRGTTYSLGYTHNPFSRLQFGVRYEQTNIRCNTYESYAMQGLLGDIRFMFNTLTGKTPYIGYGFGWLNSVRSDKTIYYNARGSFAGEWLAGYSFKLDETLRFNLEYRQRCIELKYETQPYQRSETIVGSLSWIFIPVEPVQRSLTPAEGMSSKHDYLQKKIDYNTQQMARLDALIAKYDERVLEKENDTTTTEERAYLIKQKQDLENQNTEMLKLLE